MNNTTVYCMPSFDRFDWVGCIVGKRSELFQIGKNVFNND